MYRIELLPGASTHVTPGWTYVPDRGFDPAKAALAPTIGRKRGIRDGGRTDLSSRQTNAIIRHLAELDRENHREVQIAIPVKQKDTAGRGTRGKTTSNVRRILQSQKTFRNHLDDEEAALAQAAQTTTHRPSIAKIIKPSRRSLTPAATPKPELSRQRKQRSIATPSRTSSTPADGHSVVSSATTTDETNESNETQNQNQLIKSEYDNDPLLRSFIPSAPSERIMQALLSEPPLTYNAARAGPPMTVKSPRHFCCMCGYWGKIRCKNCHVRTCGLACYKVHEDSRCGAFF
ncbi:putative HIT finger domain protein [Aspergillus clavatus NRRL 1]|uniref:HIT finger domain protein, putative n=1 Tax=Aspergillus clavatus (strain ATCC 1007 / CBS 513.65 / DSM 816 / NCTC 3887 / NRRL 1 / QM 1276 / 107) TaxID=344612 RepID=A1CEH1_ASPCL|nr:HIT finger domain protein, putative [Aspergillus clavatus NRRL 1]EAW11270.1 HIT finger domain protein, putative [Aspergillus clavatus NRRL 1]